MEPHDEIKFELHGCDSENRFLIHSERQTDDYISFTWHDINFDYKALILVEAVKQDTNLIELTRITVILHPIKFTRINYDEVTDWNTTGTVFTVQ